MLLDLNSERKSKKMFITNSCVSWLDEQLPVIQDMTKFQTGETINWKSKKCLQNNGNFL